jgi:hypothetical protein
MTSRPQRSLSVGAVPHVKPLLRSRAESASGGVLEVRCACQYFQSDSLLPERINPVGGSRPISPDCLSRAAINISHDAKLDKLLQQADDIDEPRLSILGIVTTTDYYADTANLSCPTSNAELTPLESGIDSYEYSQAGNMPGATSVKTQEFSSQRSLDKLKNSTLLQRYNKRTSSQDLQGSNVDFRQGPLMVPASQPTQAVVKNVYSSEETSDVEPMSYGREYYTRQSNVDIARSRESRYMTSSSDEGRASLSQMRRNSNLDNLTARYSGSSDVAQNVIGPDEISANQDPYSSKSVEHPSDLAENLTGSKDPFGSKSVQHDSDVAQNSDGIPANQDPFSTKSVPVKPEFSSQQSLNRMRTSSLLQKYNKRSSSQDPANNLVSDEMTLKKTMKIDLDPQPVAQSEFRRQTSVDRMKNSTLLQRYNKRSSSQDQPCTSTPSLCNENMAANNQSTIDNQPSISSNLDRMKRSSLLQRYSKRAISQDPQDRIPIENSEQPAATKVFSSQQNLDRMKNSSLLQKYNKRAQSQDRTAKEPIVVDEMRKSVKKGPPFGSYDVFDYRMSPVLFDTNGQVQVSHNSR